MEPLSWVFAFYFPEPSALLFTLACWPRVLTGACLQWTPLPILLTLSWGSIPTACYSSFPSFWIIVINLIDGCDLMNSGELNLTYYCFIVSPFPWSYWNNIILYGINSLTLNITRQTFQDLHRLQILRQHITSFWNSSTHVLGGFFSLNHCSI